MSKHGEPTHTVVITIGRNQGSAPMDDETWHNFKTGVLDSIRIAAGQVVQRPSMAKGPAGQVGVWEDQTEGAAAYVVLMNNLHNRIDRLRWLLQMDAMMYQQDAIGFIVAEGTTHLVTP